MGNVDRMLRIAIKLNFEDEIEEGKKFVEHTCSTNSIGWN